MLRYELFVEIFRVGILHQHFTVLRSSNYINLHNKEVRAIAMYKAPVLAPRREI